MTDEAIIPQELGLSGLEKKGPNKFVLPKDNEVKLTKDELAREFKVTNQPAKTETVWSRNDKRFVLEIAEAPTVSGGMEVDFAVAPDAEGVENAFLITNEHSEAPLIVWVYGRKEVILPNNSLAVPSKRPDGLQNIQGIEDGVFYVATGDKEAVKVNRAPLSPEVKVKHFTVNEVTPPPEENVSESLSEEDYSKAKDEIKNELELERKQIERDTAAYSEKLKEPWANGEGLSRLSQDLKDEMLQDVKENKAALTWIDTQSDDPEMRKLVAKRLERSAHDLLLIQGYIVSNQRDGSFEDPEVLEKNKKRAENLFRLAKTIMP